jgi:hypothetical protein
MWRCAEGERRCGGTVRIVAWVLWLSGPVVATVIAALWSWLRARPEPLPDTDEAMRAHAEYLEALTHSARAKDRGLRSD